MLFGEHCLRERAATVDVDDAAGHILGAGTTAELDHPGDLVGVTDPLEWESSLELCDSLFVPQAGFGHQRRVDQAGYDAVDPYVGAELLGQSLRETEDAGLGGGVVDATACGSALTRTAGDVDDVAPLALEHRRRGVSGDVVLPFQVHVDDLVPLVGFEVADPKVPAVAGVVNHGAEVGDGLYIFDHLADGLVVRDVALVGSHARPEVVCQDGHCRIEVQAGDHVVTVVSREPLDYTLADPARRSGNQCRSLLCHGPDLGSGRQRCCSIGGEEWELGGTRDEQRFILPGRAVASMFESIDRETESELVDRIDADRMIEHVDVLADLTRHSGSEGERAGTDYVVAQLQEYGVDVEYGEYEAYISDPGDASLTVTAPTGWQVPDGEVVTVAFGAATPPAGVHGEVDFVPEVTDRALASLDLDGRIVFTPGLPTPGPVEKLAEAGAKAAVFESPTEGHQHEMIVTPVWGTPGVGDEGRIPDLPVVEISQSAGERLRDQLDRGPVEAAVETSVTTDRVDLPCPVGRIEGRESDRYYVVGNHVDSWHEGVTDNATAVAATLELARVFADRDESPRRGLLFGFWTAHSFGRYAGSTWFVDDHFPDLRENGLAYIHLDLNGLKGAERLWYQHMAAVEDEHIDVLDSVPDLELPEGTGESSFLGDDRPGRNSDQSFWGAGLVSLLSGARLTPETPEGGPVGGGWWWHTPDDTRDKVDPDVLVEEVKLYAALAARICESPFLPFDHAKSAAAIGESVENLEFSHDALDDVRERAAELERTVAEANRIGDARADDPAVASAVEDLQIELGNRLVPALYKARPDHKHDRALSQGRLPGIVAVGDPENRSGRAQLFAETSLRREANRLEELIRDSTQLAAAFVDEHGE